MPGPEDRLIAVKRECEGPHCCLFCCCAVFALSEATARPDKFSEIRGNCTGNIVCMFSYNNVRYRAYQRPVLSASL